MTDNTGKRFKDSYVITPEHFKNVVANTVNAQLAMGNSGKTEAAMGKRRRFMKVAVVAAALVATIGTGAYAAYHSGIFDIYGDRFVSESEAEKHTTIEENKINQKVSSSWPAVMEELYGDQMGEGVEEAMMVIDEVYYDGMTLYVYGHCTEEGEKYTFGSDRLVIDGKIYLANLWKGDGQYDVVSGDMSGATKFSGSVELMDADLPESFTAEIPFLISDRESEKTGHQTISFGVSSDNKVRVTEAITTTSAGGADVYVEPVKISPSGASVVVRWTFAGEDAKEKAEAFGIKMEGEGRNVFCLITDDQGNQYEDRLGALRPQTAVYDENSEEIDWGAENKVYKNDDGSYVVQRAFLLAGAPLDVKSLKVEPFQWSDDQTERIMLDYGSFEIRLD